MNAYSVEVVCTGKTEIIVRANNVGEAIEEALEIFQANHFNQPVRNLNRISTFVEPNDVDQI